MTTVYDFITPPNLKTGGTSNRCGCLHEAIVPESRRAAPASGSAIGRLWTNPPRRGAGNVSGREESAKPQAAEGNSQVDESCPVHPEVDTMEYRASDGQLYDYGPGV